LWNNLKVLSRASKIYQGTKTVPKKDDEIEVKSEESSGCKTNSIPDDLYEPLQPRVASGKAPVLVEIICERVHCVLYDFAINTVDMIADKFEGLIDIRTVIRQGDEKDAKYFLTLCEKAGKMLTVPTILINGKVIFSTVPHPNELEAAIEAALAQKGILPKQ
jgi:hypothetical protein